MKEEVMDIKPIGERIVVKHIEVENKTASGIILPDSAKKEPKYAEVIAISDEIKEDDEKKDLVEEGDYVIYSSYAGTDVESDDVKYTIVELEDVQAVVEE